MKVWIDFINTPQVSLLAPIIDDLQNEGYEFVLTCRDSGNTLQLLSQNGLVAKIIGNRAQKGFFRKLLAYPLRVYKLWNYLKSQKPDIGVCQSSFYLPITSFMLGIPSIYTNDNEHALGNIPSFIFSSKILIPEFMPYKSVVRQGASIKKIIKYPGVKEGIYLWQKGDKIHKQRPISKEFKIFIRPEPTTAQYYKGDKNFLDNIILGLQESQKIVLLPRDREQVNYYKNSKFKKIQVCEKSLPLDSVANECRLFIGAGGSMTREMAILGVPTISVYQGELLGVDLFLISQGLLLHEPNLNIETVLDFLKKKNPDIIKANTELLSKGENAFNLIKETIKKYN